MFDLPKYGAGIGLARMAALLDALGIDRTHLQRCAVVITGSNGKGSTAAFCASIGRAAGLRTGLFTSPHLFRYNERFRINGTPVDDATLARLEAHIASAITDLARSGLIGQFGAFEAQFALACLLFQDEACDFMVFEAGIGGRYDACRLIGADVTAVTSVDLEHVNLLGNTLELIASDKSDACAAGGTIVYGENCRSLRAHLAEYNRSRDVTGLFVRDEIAIANASTSTTLQRFALRYGDTEFAALGTALLGDFQLNNAAIAAMLYLLWRKRTAPDVSMAAIESAIRAGLHDAIWHGRLERIQDAPLTIVDVGHTPDGVNQALGSLKAIHGPDDWILVTGVSADKNLDEIAAHLVPAFTTVICTAAHHKGADPERVAAAARRARPDAEIHVAASIEQAVTLSQTLARERQQKIYVAGGLFVAIEYAATLRGDCARDLKFF